MNTVAFIISLLFLGFSMHGNEPSMKEGFFTIMITGQDAAIDFSQLEPDSLYGYFTSQTVDTPDIIFAGMGVQEIHAPYGIVEIDASYNLSALETYFNSNPESRDCSYSTSIPSDCMSRYHQFIEDHPIPIPTDDFNTMVEVSFFSLEFPIYYVRTQEGNMIMLWQIGEYIGGIDRRHYYWRYVD